MKWPAAPCPLPLRKRTPPLRIGWLLGCVLVAAVPTLAAQPLVPPPATDPVDEYLAAIEDAESAGGAYAAELVDLYYGMGQALLRQGELEWARDAFHQTVMVVRVNSGPYSVQQTRYLYSIADIESRLGNPAAAIEVLNNIYEIFARHQRRRQPGAARGRGSHL
jgi:tetratricopeptide (TPR) repeat protein